MRSSIIERSLSPSQVREAKKSQQHQHQRESLWRSSSFEPVDQYNGKKKWKSWNIGPEARDHGTTAKERIECVLLVSRAK